MEFLRNYQPDPVAFTIGGLEIMWYAICICTGMILAVLIACSRAPRRGLTADDVLDYALVMIPGGIVGARLYYVIFKLENFHSFYDVINLRAGGLAIHGGLIAAFLCAYFLSRKKKNRPLDLLDLAVPVIALGQSIGRWGNYFNSEAHGGPTSLPWGILVDGQYVHPTFLYESIWCMFLFILLSRVDKNRTFAGQVTMMYCALYSLERFFVESLRTDSLMIGPFRQAMVLSGTCFIASVVLYLLLKKRADVGAPGTSGDAKESVS